MAIANFAETAGPAPIDSRGAGSIVPAMDVTKIRQYLGARPFKPFRLVLPNDREISVPHPEFMAISPNGVTAMIWARNGKDELIDLRWVLSLKTKADAAKRH